MIGCGATSSSPDAPHVAHTASAVSSEIPISSASVDPNEKPVDEKIYVAPVVSSALRPEKTRAALTGEAIRSLSVPGFLPAVVSVPLGAVSPKPVLIATHGNYDTPDWQCEVWSSIVGAKGFVLCPRGIRRSDSPSSDDIRYEYSSNQSLEKEIDKGVEALRKEFPEYVADGPIVFTGFSLGAIMGVAIVARRADVYTRMVLIEGGDAWTRQSAFLFRQMGGERVMFACSQPGCTSSAKVASSVLQKAGVSTLVVSGKNEGHTYGGDVLKQYAAQFSWVVQDDPRWQ